MRSIFYLEEVDVISLKIYYIIYSIESMEFSFADDYCDPPKTNTKLCKDLHLFREMNKFKFNNILFIGLDTENLIDVLFENKIVIDVCNYSKYHDYDTGKIRNIYRSEYSELKLNEKYDAIWCGNVFIHHMGISIFFKNIYQMLNDNGILVIVMPKTDQFVVNGCNGLWNKNLLIQYCISGGFKCGETDVLFSDDEIGIIIKK
jgi:hypothetical protein